MTDLFAAVALQKQKLRERLRFRRRHFAANLDGMAKLAAFRVMPAPLADIIDGLTPVGGYLAWGDEPNIRPLLLPLAENGALALPHHRGRAEAMDFRRWSFGESLVVGPWGPQQPQNGAESIVPRLIFCPLVGFDRRGGRLGQGGGHYDRYFAAHPDILRIGVGWSVQEIDVVPVESTDAALDAVLTEQEFIRCGDRL